MTVFNGLTRELLREKKHQSVYNTYLYRAGLFQIGGTLTWDERMTESVKQISTATIKFAGFSIVRTINSKQPLKRLDSLFDLLAAVGKAFYLNILVKNNGKLLQEIKYEAEMELEKAQKEFVVELKDKTTLMKCCLAGSLLLTPPFSGDTVKDEVVNESFYSLPPFPSIGISEDSTFGERLQPDSGVKSAKKLKTYP